VTARAVLYGGIDKRPVRIEGVASAADVQRVVDAPADES
jgi:hypothetical protein